MVVSDTMQVKLGQNSAIRMMFEEGKRMAAEVGRENVYDFSLGNPNVPAPHEVNEALLRLIRETDSVKLHGYMSNAGFEEVRGAIAEKLNRTYGTAFSGNNLIMTVGAASGLNVIFKTILNPGEEVIVFKPYFMEYRHYVDNYGGKLVEVGTKAETFLPDLDALRAALTERTKAVLINTPNNPTGAVYGAETLTALADVLRKAQERFGTQILLISDEPYRELVYDGVRAPFVTRFYENTVICYSYSKSLSLPGERIGYLVIPDAVSDSGQVIAAAAIANRILGAVNAPSLMQLAVAECADADLAPNIAAYDRNRKLLYGIVKSCGFEAVYPQGAFYLWIKTPIDDRVFSAHCKRHYLLVVPGSSFGCAGYVRASYCVSGEMIRASEKAWRAIAAELSGDNAKL